MSGSWFNVDINSLQSSIMDSMGEASKLMEELNLDNMQKESPVPNKGNDVKLNSISSTTMNSSTVEYPNPSEERNDFNESIQPYPLSDVNSESETYDNSLTQTSLEIASGLISESRGNPEMEEVVEFTEFGVPIRILQPKKQSPIISSLTPDHREIEDKEGKIEQNIGFNIWNLDSLQQERNNIQDEQLPNVLKDEQRSTPTAVDDNVIIDSSLPLYVDQSIMSRYLYSNGNLIDESTNQELYDKEGSAQIPEVGVTATEDECIVQTLSHPVDNTEKHSFFGVAKSLAYNSTDTRVPDAFHTRSSFFDEDDSDNDRSIDAFKRNDPIYQRVEQNKINPPLLRPSQQSIFQSGSAFFVPGTPPTQNAKNPIRPNVQSYGTISRIITFFMYMLRMAYNFMTRICEVTMNMLRSMFDIPSSSSSSVSYSTMANNFCEAMQHPATRAEIFASYRSNIFNIIVSNNFIAFMTILLLAATYWKFRRYGTDSGD